jgi:tetratricopeptide (TPR) repeat protein
MPAAVAAFRAALDIDPTCTQAHAGLALTRCAQANLRTVPHADAYAEAKAASLLALAADSGSADAQTALGTVMFLSEWDWAGAERCLRRALDIDPDHTEALLQYGALNDALGNGERGLRLKQQVLARAPHSPLVLMEIAVSYSLQRKFDQAIAWAKKALALDARNQRATEFLTMTCWLVGDMASAIGEKRRRAEALGVAGDAREALERGLAELEAHSRRGRHDVARFLLESFPKGADSRSSLQRAGLYAALGDIDAAFEHLDRALAMRDPLLVYLAVMAVWDPLRGDPRMTQRLERARLPVVIRSGNASTHS